MVCSVERTPPLKNAKTKTLEVVHPAFLSPVGPAGFEPEIKRLCVQIQLMGKFYMLW
jgi:hypothetical protein